MYRFPLKVTYGILATIELARSDRFVPVQAKIIAKRQQIPARFIEQILQQLRQGGIVQSLRGPQGGYTLALEPIHISLDQVVNAMSGPVTSPQIENGISPGQGKSNGHQVTHTLLTAIWEEVEEAQQSVLRGITIKALTEEYERLESQEGLMYHI